MRGWRVHEYGDYHEKLRWENLAEPSAEGDSSVIAVKAAGVMYADLLNIAGTYQVKAPLPFVPGSEAAGVVVDAGPLSRFKVGDRVVAINLMGAFAERMIALDQTTLPVPESISDEDAAALTINYQTAYFALVYRANTLPGEFVVVHGGAGGVGTAAIQLAKHLGATVIATAGSAEKLAVCKQCGADFAVDYSTADWVTKVREITSGNGVDVVIDPVGGDVFEQSTKCIAFEGRLVVIGFAGGRIPSIAANKILLKNIAITGLFWGSYQTRNHDLVLKTQEILYDLHRKGVIDPVIYRAYSMDELPQALEAIQTRQCYGKPLVVN